jgi:hypothetical protein
VELVKIATIAKPTTRDTRLLWDALCDAMLTSDLDINDQIGVLTVLVMRALTLHYGATHEQARKLLLAMVDGQPPMSTRVH